MSNDRSFPRFSLTIPLEIRKAVGDNGEPKEQFTVYAESKNISAGGIAFRTNVELEIGLFIQIKILVDKPFDLIAKIAWCKTNNNGFDTGVEIMARQANLLENMMQLTNFFNK